MFQCDRILFDLTHLEEEQVIGEAWRPVAAHTVHTDHLSPGELQRARQGHHVTHLEQRTEIGAV